MCPYYICCWSINSVNKLTMWSVLHPEPFWSQYTGLGSQTQTPKHSKVLISGVNFCQCSLSQSQESNVLSYSECKITKNFHGFTPAPHWGGLTVLLTSSCTMVFLLVTLVEKLTPPKSCWIYGTGDIDNFLLLIWFFSWLSSIISFLLCWVSSRVLDL